MSEMAELEIHLIAPLLHAEYWHAILKYTLGWRYAGGVWFSLKIAKLSDGNLRSCSTESQLY